MGCFILDLRLQLILIDTKMSGIQIFGWKCLTNNFLNNPCFYSKGAWINVKCEGLPNQTGYNMLVEKYIFGL